MNATSTSEGNRATPAERRTSTEFEDTRSGRVPVEQAVREEHDIHHNCSQAAPGDGRAPTRPEEDTRGRRVRVQRAVREGHDATSDSEGPHPKC